MSRHQYDARLFEIGRVFAADGKESLRLAVAATGRREPESWETGGRDAKLDYYDVKGALEELAAGVGRSFGQIPQFLPFGRVAGEESLYGFYLGPHTEDEAPLILYWDEGEAFLRPVASDFEAFLRRSVVTGRYETDDEWPGSSLPDRARLDLFRTLINIPPLLFEARLPGNDTELYQRLVGLDPQDSVSLSHLGCAARSNGEEERALDFFHRASEAAPWFGDPSYLMADVYRRRENFERAMSDTGKSSSTRLRFVRAPGNGILVRIIRTPTCMKLPQMPLPNSMGPLP